MSLRRSEATEAISDVLEKIEIAALPSVARNDESPIMAQSPRERAFTFRDQALSRREKRAPPGPASQRRDLRRVRGGSRGSCRAAGPGEGPNGQSE